MRRTTRRTAKRVSLTPDSSDDEEPGKLETIKNTPMAQKVQMKKNKPNKLSVNKNNNDSSSSESDIENYLKSADQIDLSSKFFQITREETPSFDAIENDILADVQKLSDSDSELEKDGDDNSVMDPPIENAPKLNFQQIYDYSKKLEDAKKHIQKYETKKIAQDIKKRKANKMPEENKLDILNMLAIGETKLTESQENELANGSDFDSFSESEKEDWEEVKGQDVKDAKEDNLVPKEGVQITVQLSGTMRQKKGVDLMAAMKRRINRIKKETQVFVHKVHLLCWLAHGNYVNKVLNSESLLALALSLLPSQHCYPSAHTDLSYLEQIVRWYTKTIVDGNISIRENESLEKTMEAQITNKKAYDQKMKVYIFICILRSLGIQCRLILSFQVEPLRPPSSELGSEKKTVNESGRNSSSKSGSKASTPGSSSKASAPTSKKHKEKLKTEAADKGEGSKTKVTSTSQMPKGKSKEVASSSRSAGKGTKRVLQVDGPNDDSDDEPLVSSSKRLKTLHKPNLSKLKQEVKNPCTVKVHPKRLKSLHSYKEPDSEEDIKSSTKQKLRIFSSTQTSAKTPNSNMKSKASSSSVSSTQSNKPKKQSNVTSEPTSKLNFTSLKNGAGSSSRSSTSFTPNSSEKQDVRNDIIDIMKKRISEQKEIDSGKLVKSRKSQRHSAEDSDYAPEEVKRKQHDSDDEIVEKTRTKVKQRVKVRKDIEEEGKKKKQGVDVWAEVFLEAEEKWISVDVVKGKVHCVSDLYAKATHPISYIIAWNNNNSIKDITQRYCSQWNTVARKLRTDPKWWKATLKPYTGRKTARDKEEDEELARIQLDRPLPTSISEYKNHPLYILKRHLLKFEAIYPPDAVTLGFIKEEAVYSRDCVHVLHSRDIWLKHAKTVKLGEKPYKIVKARPKYDKLSGQVVSDLLLEIFGYWQVEDYVPPTAANGVVPRNAYGNVELFKACMLPKKTVHLQLPGLNKVARKLNMDCVPAVVGFDFHGGWNHPTYDGFVVCEENAEVLIAAWHVEQEEQEKKEIEKLENRVYGNWKKLIRGLLIRQRLNARYDFAAGTAKEPRGKGKQKSKRGKCVAKKRQICSDDVSD